MCVCVASVHVRETGAAELALTVQTVVVPEPAAVKVAALPAASHFGGLLITAVPER